MANTTPDRNETTTYDDFVDFLDRSNDFDETFFGLPYVRRFEYVDTNVFVYVDSTRPIVVITSNDDVTTTYRYDEFDSIDDFYDAVSNTIESYVVRRS